MQVNSIENNPSPQSPEEYVCEKRKQVYERLQKIDALLTQNIGDRKKFRFSGDDNSSEDEHKLHTLKDIHEAINSLTNDWSELVQEEEDFNSTEEIPDGYKTAQELEEYFERTKNKLKDIYKNFKENAETQKSFYKGEPSPESLKELKDYVRSKLSVSGKNNEELTAEIKQLLEENKDGEKNHDLSFSAWFMYDWEQIKEDLTKELIEELG